MPEIRFGDFKLTVYPGFALQDGDIYKIQYNGQWIDMECSLFWSCDSEYYGSNPYADVMCRCNVLQ